jgi:hypothetical protein
MSVLDQSLWSMHDALSDLAVGSQISIRLANGAHVQGQIEARDSSWLRLRTPVGTSYVQLTHIAVISVGGDAVGEGLPKPTSKDAPVKSGARAPGRAWSEDELRLLADAFLDGKHDSDLAERFHRTRGAIKEMHQGFEAARGNLVEDQISPVARTWVSRWRRVLGG